MSEGLYPPESVGQWCRAWRGIGPGHCRPAVPTREIPDGKPTLKVRATIRLADLERYIAAVKAGGTGEGVALAGALADVERKAER